MQTAGRFLYLFAGIIACGAAAIAAADEEVPGLTKLADGVYVHQVDPDTNAVANAGILLLENGVLIFDTHFTPEAGEALLKKIGALSSKPVLFAVNSHFHPDHTHGNQVLSPGTLIISSTPTRRDVLQRDLPAMNRAVGAAQDQIKKMQKGLARTAESADRDPIRTQITARQELLNRMTRLRIVAPVVTFEEELSILDGGRELHLRRIGVGHTDGDIILYLPAERIAFVGDLFYNDALPGAQDATLLQWIKTLNELLKLDAEKFVPGHGAVGTKDDVREFLRYLEDLRAIVQDGLGRGQTVEQLLAEARIPAKYAGYRFQNLFASNVRKMYDELKSLQAAQVPGKGAAKRRESDKP